MRQRRNAFVMDRLEARQLFAVAPTNQVVGYVPNYEYGGGVNLSKIDWNAVTQLNYFAIIPNADGTMNVPAGDLANIDATVAAAHQHGVKVSLVFGGAGQDANLRQIINTSAVWNTFSSTVNNFCTLHQLDGVDLDWEPGPGSSYPSAVEFTNYGSFIHAMKTAMPALTLSAAVNPEKLPIGGDWDHRAYILNAEAVQYLDQIGLMTYDLEYNVNSSIAHAELDMNDWITYVGSSKFKLLLGLPFYGTYGTDSVNWSNTTAHTYAEVINGYIAQTGQAPDTSVNSQALNVSFPGQFGNAAVPWSINSKGIIAKKTDDAVLANIGGVMIWELGQDHFGAGGAYDTYSLLPVIKNTINGRSTLIGSSGTFLTDTRPAVRVSFSTSLTGSSIGPADLVLTNLTTGQTINTGTLAAITNDVASKSATWSFNTSLLPDGNYHAVLPAGSVRDTTGRPLSVDYSFDFFVLSGDANHDRKVDAKDLGILAVNWQGAPRTFAQADFNYDGKVDIKDLAILAAKWQTILAAPPPGALPASLGTSSGRSATRVASLILS